MSSIRRFMACTAASALLTVGGVALAAPAQAQTDVARQSATVVLAGTDDGSGTAPQCGLLGLGCILSGLLGGLLG
ncbi:hypothetical protein ACIRU3_11320 [Streptomyces sp. NPDC101151]|uniref:hypothetical protein n=1 Tax=Streptomyces sp. NPDC101151 TaxID=3366115 RepID=UPI00382C3A6F